MRSFKSGIKRRGKNWANVTYNNLYFGAFLSISDRNDIIKWVFGVRDSIYISNQISIKTAIGRQIL